MKVWVHRAKGSNFVAIWEDPPQTEDRVGCYFDSVGKFKTRFGFVPPKGSDKEYEAIKKTVYVLTEIQRKAKP